MKNPPGNPGGDLAPWSSWIRRRPFKPEALGSSPAGVTIIRLRGGTGKHIRFKPGCRNGLRVRLPSQAPCASGGTGIRAGLKYRSPDRACEFESHLVHHDPGWCNGQHDRLCPDTLRFKSQPGAIWSRSQDARLRIANPRSSVRPGPGPPLCRMMSDGSDTGPENRGWLKSHGGRHLHPAPITHDARIQKVSHRSYYCFA